MISQRSKGIQTLLLLCQCLLVTGIFWAWLFLSYPLPVGRDVATRYLMYNEFVLLGLLFGSRPTGATVDPLCLRVEETLRRSFRQLGGALFYLLCYIVGAKDPAISRQFLFSLIPVLYATLCVTHLYLPALLGRLTFNERYLQKVLLVGPRRKALQAKGWFDQKKHLGLNIIGLLTEDEDQAEAGPLPSLGRPADLEQILADPGIVQVIMVEFPRSNGDMRHLTALCERRGIRLLVLADLDQIFGHPFSIFEDHGLVFIGLRQEPLEDPINRFFKRCFDIAVSLPVVIFILPPLMIFVGICHRLQSPGPLFYVQRRQGFHNRPFPLLKFRTMHLWAPANNALSSSASDPRLFRAGALLRKTSLDEMPQFLNVLRGEMSIVGPRPHLQSDNQEWRRSYPRVDVRSFVKPGITGLAQTRGFRGMIQTPTEVEARMESDIEYLENWSLWLDFWLVLRTAAQVVTPPRTAV